MRRIALASLAVVAGLLVPPGVRAEPTVVGYELVSSVRVSRTLFDFTYRVQIEGDVHSLRNAELVVTSNRSATQVFDGTIAVGDLDAGRFVRPSDTFTIRQDRTVAFDRNALSFTFSGQESGVATAPDGLRIGPLEFVESGGRPDHEGTFPIQGANPTAGAEISMQVDVYGDVVHASYEMLDGTGQVLIHGVLSRTPDELNSPCFAASVTIPGVPFRVAIVALGTNSEALSWQSALYTPPTTALHIAPATAILTKGQTIPLILHVTSSATGTWSVRLQLPPGFTGNAGPWVVTVSPGQTSDVSTTLTAPASGKPFARYVLVADAVGVSGSGPPVIAHLDLEVE